MGRLIFHHDSQWTLALAPTLILTLTCPLSNIEGETFQQHQWQESALQRGLV